MSLLDAPFSFTRKEYYEWAGLAETTEDDTTELDIAIKQVCEFVWNFTMSESGKPWMLMAKSLSVFQTEVFKRASMLQLQYEILNGSVRNSSGISYESGGGLSWEELQKREINPQAYKLLLSKGFLYKGIG